MGRTPSDAALRGRSVSLDAAAALVWLTDTMLRWVSPPGLGGDPHSRAYTGPSPAGLDK